jgi:hypothetical protein
MQKDSEQPESAGAVSSTRLLDDGEQHKYLEVEITRTQGTLVFLKVPKDFNHRACLNLQEILKAAAVETCDESDWRLGSDQWEDSVEWQAIKEVPKAKAEAYKMHEVESSNESSSAAAKQTELVHRPLNYCAKCVLHCVEYACPVCGNDLRREPEPAREEIVPAPACGYAALAERWERRLNRMSGPRRDLLDFTKGLQLKECLKELRAEMEVPHIEKLRRAEAEPGTGTDQ